GGRRGCRGVGARAADPRSRAAVLRADRRRDRARRRAWASREAGDPDDDRRRRRDPDRGRARRRPRHRRLADPARDGRRAPRHDGGGRRPADPDAGRVVALHRPGGGNLAIERLVDALIGGGLAILLARLLFPIDPLELVRAEARVVRVQLAEALDAVADALAGRDRGRAHTALGRVEAIDDRRLEEALSLAREISRSAPRRRPLRRRIETLARVYGELDASVADARAIATGALRVLDTDRPTDGAADAVRAAAAAVRTIDPDEARAAAEAARASARSLRAADDSLGAGVLAHGIAAVADHTANAAEARDEDARLAAGARNRFPRLHVGRETST